MRKGSRIYDYTLSDAGLMMPAPLCNTFVGPNGLSLKPVGPQMYELVGSARGDASVFEVPKGAQLPPDLVLLHEFSQHYSLQPARAMKPSEFIHLAKLFFKPFPILTKDEYLDKYPYDGEI